MQSANMPQPHKPILQKTIKAVRAMTARLKSLQREAVKIEKELLAYLNPGKHPPVIAANAGTTSERRKAFKDCWKRAADAYKAVRSRPGCDELTFEEVFNRLLHLLDEPFAGQPLIHWCPACWEPIASVTRIGVSEVGSTRVT